MYSRQLYAFGILTFFLLFQIPVQLRAQYFGRNQVQYEDFNFQVLHTEHFDIYHYPREFVAVQDAAKLAERWYYRHSNMLNHTFKIRNSVILYANHADFQQTDIIPRISVGTGGVTEGLGNRVIMPFAKANSSTNHVLGHELVHAFQYDIARGEEIGGISAAGRLPLWFIEGMAEYLSLGPQDVHTAMWLRDAVLYEDVPSIDDLSNPAEYFPYRYGHSVWAFIAGQWGDDVIPDLYVASARFGPENGFREVLGISIDSVSALWQNSVKTRYTDDVQVKDAPDEVGKLILGESKGTGEMNIAPSLSPDGKYVAFISEKNVFSMELFLADAQTGEIIRKLTSTTTQPHLSALRFIESSGSWSPDGRLFAAVAFARGDNEILIIDVEEGGIRQTIRLDEVGAMLNPAWSPDGEKIAFSGADGGYSDIYIYNLETDSLKNITDDPYSDLQPVWAPDGGRLAFVTDRGPGTDFDKLTFGNMGIAVLDVYTGSITMIPEFYDAKHINPQFSPDGSSLYYVSDYQGFSNIYRYDFETDDRYQVTDVATGISGISEFSPAITVAQETGEIMATVFNNGNYSIYKIPDDERQGRQLINFSRVIRSGWLPSADAQGNRRVISYLNNPITDLPADTAFSLTDYTPRLRLEYIGGGAGLGFSNRFGIGAAGGINMMFSDILRQHQLFATLRLQGTLKDLGGEIGYLNRDRRFIWGGSVSHFSYLTRATGAARDTIQVEDNPAPVLRVDQQNRRIFQDRVSALGMYPFSRTQRLETSLSYQRISYDFELVQTYLSPDGRFVFDQTEEGLPGPSPLNLASASLAYVEDNSIAAFTGPIMGHRLRLELAPTTGTLTFLTTLADYRRYFYFRPFTLAFRALHAGRYLQDSESNRLSPNFLGYESLVRGYNTASFEPQECSEGCPEFTRLTGSRIAVANAELRIPVLGIEDIALFRTRILPVTLVGFFDSGVAWTSAEAPVLEWDRDSAERIPVFSAGVSLRINVLGYLITELYYAIPFQRPEKGGYIGFHIAPGW